MASILCVEDEEDLPMDIAEELEDAGCEVLQARDRIRVGTSNVVPHFTYFIM